MSTTTRIELPDGGWAELRDPDKVTERDRRPFLKATNAVLNAPDVDDYDGPLALYDHVLGFVVTAWSYGDKFDPEDALDLPIGVYDRLRRHADAFLKAVTPDFSYSPDEDSPTTPSDA